MINYTIDMFDISKLQERFKPLFLEKETIEYKLNIYETKFTALKNKHYKDLLIYERKKTFDKTLLPNLKVISQLKISENNVVIKEFKQIISTLKQELLNIQSIIDKEATKINSMFTFEYMNLKQYLDLLNKYFNNELPFENLMKFIFNIEFLNSDMYNDISGLRNYPILALLIKKIPAAWKDLATIIYGEVKYIYTLEDLQNNTPDAVDVFIQSEKIKREERKNKAWSIQQKLIAENDTTKQNYTTLNNSLQDRPQEIATNFIISRIDRHKEILTNSKKYLITRGDWVTKMGEYITSPNSK